MLVMDSGLGGLSVVRALKKAQPEVVLTYLADTGGFPYGSKDASVLTGRAIGLIRTLATLTPPSTVVLACNTLSTLCLDQLRASFAYPFVGTVPAIKTAAAQTETKRFTLLATPNTAHSSYSEGLIEEFAQGCKVDCYGAPNLANFAEHMLLGGEIDDARLAAELAPCFQDDAAGKTDAVVLGCTHYPLILERLQNVAPWEVQWIDSGEAIARRALTFAGMHSDEDDAPKTSVAYVTTEEDVARYRALFLREGFDEVAAITLA